MTCPHAHARCLQLPSQLLVLLCAPVCPHAPLQLPSGSGKPAAAAPSSAAHASVNWPDLSPADRASLVAAAKCLKNRVTWFAEYGCALVAVGGLRHGGDAGGTAVVAELEDPRPQPDHISLHLVAPEGWRFEAHR
jgi:hypothetical protein